jgi:hypothetical protein
MLNQKALAASVSAGPKTYVEDVFSTWLYTGNGSTQTITNGIDLSGKGGLVWTKNRSATANHFLIDSARNNDSYLISNSTGGEASAGSTFNVVFNSNGFTDGLSNRFFSGDNIASWTFRKAAKFFDVVTYTGNGVAGRTIPHNLGSVPGCIIVKRTNTGSAWPVYHRGETRTAGSPARTYLLELDTTAAGAYPGSSDWIGSPASSTFEVGDGPNVNSSGSTYVAYLFAHDAGGFGDAGTDSVIKCGSVSDPGTGVTVDLGWEPQWVLLKRTSSTGGNWRVIDNMRGWPMYAEASRQLFPNTSGAEDASEAWGNPTATGFFLNASATGSYIYIAIRRGPMKTPTVGTSVFSALLRTGTSATATVSSLAFPTDATLIKTRTSTGYDWNVFDRLRGATKKLATNGTTSESTETNGLNNYASMTGYTLGPGGEVNLSSDNFVDFNFRRAPGFFDVVAYTGTGSARTVSHNLGVVPEFCIVKRRDATAFWPTWSSAFTSFQYVALNETSSKYDDGSSNQTFSFTSTGWSIGTTYSSVNASGATYIAYLFASCPGVSKVGSYTGTGTTLSVDCGFTAGARFVLIKRTDSTGDWYVWDTARGIVSGNDPYLLLNSTAAEVTSTDYIDPLSSGFQISSTAPAAINANGGSFIYLAVA